MYDPKTMVPHRHLPPYARDLFGSSGAPHIALTDLPAEDEGRKKKKPKPKTYVFPQLTVAEVQSIEKEWLKPGLPVGKPLGLPLHTLYLQGNLSKYKKEDIERLSTHVSKVCSHRSGAEDSRGGDVVVVTVHATGLAMGSQSFFI